MFLLAVGLYYILPVIQLVFYHQNTMLTTGDQGPFDTYTQWLYQKERSLLYILYSTARNFPVQFVLPRQILKINQQVTTVQEFMFSRVLYVGGGPTVQRFYNLDSQEKNTQTILINF